jgi:hypothetical protein
MKEVAIKNDALLTALEVAQKGGSTEKLYRELMTASGLPGTRANVSLANALADEFARRGQSMDALLTKMASIHADEMPGGSPMEFIPMCGVLGWGARGASDTKVRREALSLLHEAADDLRFRVREAVILSLIRLGAVMGDVLVLEVEPWMDGFFHAANVLTALSDPAWRNETHDAEPVIQRLREAAELIRHATRSSMRYPGYKALLDALIKSPALLASRHGAGVLDEVQRWTTVGNVDLREAATAAVRDEKTKARFLDNVNEIHKSRDAAVPAPRDGKKVDLPTRKRGKRR